MKNYSVTGKENGFDYVDLGLPSKTMWATSNIGAETPDDEGLYFQHAKIDGYKFGDENNKFVPVEKYKYKYNRPNQKLKACDDAACANMKGRWKMPSTAEYGELFEYADAERVENGWMFKSKVNGNTLFFPFVNSWYDKWYECHKQNELGTLWTSETCDEETLGAFCMDYQSDFIYDIYAGELCNGYDKASAYPIRAIFVNK